MRKFFFALILTSSFFSVSNIYSTETTPEIQKLSRSSHFPKDTRTAEQIEEKDRSNKRTQSIIRVFSIFLILAIVPLVSKTFRPNKSVSKKDEENGKQVIKK
ncbi:MAG TPA: hypothetical protein PLZ43_11625 [bacterium]|nr:hypothetical protein [bacterium]